MTGGGMKCWGINSNGQLGIGSTDTKLSPVDVSLTTGIIMCAYTIIASDLDKYAIHDLNTIFDHSDCKVLLHNVKCWELVG